MATAALGALNGCSSMIGSSGPSDKEISSRGPTVLYVRAQPGTIELNRNLQPTQSAEVLADVKDFRDKVTEVKLRFVNVPLEIPMKNVGGTTWRAELTAAQLKKLAVSGETIRYETEVVAKNSKGQIAVSDKPAVVAIKAPELSKRVS